VEMKETLVFGLCSL